MPLCRSTLALASLACAAAAAQVPSPPADARVLGGEALEAHLAGHVLHWQSPSGHRFRLQVQRNGFAFIDVDEFRDSGSWRAEADRACWKWREMGEGCNEFVVAAGRLWIRLAGGKLVPVKVE